MQRFCIFLLALLCAFVAVGQEKKEIDLEKLFTEPTVAPNKEIENNVRTAQEINDAKQEANNVSMPPTIMGAVAKKMFTCEGECKSSSYVSVSAQMVCGLLATCVIEHFSMSGGPGWLSDKSTSGLPITITDTGQGIAGTYSWVASFSNDKTCSGTVAVGRRNVTIQVYDDCREAGTYEY